MSERATKEEALREVIAWLEQMRPTMWDGAQDVDEMLPRLRAALAAQPIPDSEVDDG